MLSQTIGSLLPLAIAAALSPIPIVAVILMLSTPKARTNGPAFAAGWIAALVIIIVIVLFAASNADTSETTNDAVNWLKIVLGVAFFAMAAKQWRKRPRHGERPAMPAWMASISDVTEPKALGLGALLAGVNPKNLALTVAASASIAQADLSAGESAAAAAVYVAIASLTVVGAVAFYLIAPRTAEKPLAAMKGFMSDNNAVIMMVILVILGAKLVGDGISGLAA